MTLVTENIEIKSLDDQLNMNVNHYQETTHDNSDSEDFNSNTDLDNGFVLTQSTHSETSTKCRKTSGLKTKDNKEPTIQLQQSNDKISSINSGTIQESSSDNFNSQLGINTFHQIMNFILTLSCLIVTMIKDFWKKYISKFKIIKKLKTYFGESMSLCPCRLLTKYRSSLQQKNIHNFRTKMRILNTNNSACCPLAPPSTANKLCTYTFITAASIVAFFSYCWFHPEAKICQVSDIALQVRYYVRVILKDIYRLPGVDCMTYGRCCKGILEATVRWILCLSTILIRSTLTAIPRNPHIEGSEETIETIKAMVDKIMNELHEIKDRSVKLEEILKKLREGFIKLEKQMEDRSNDLSLMEPQIVSAMEKMKVIKKNTTHIQNQLKHLLSVRKEAEKLIEVMKTIARDTAANLKGAVARLQGSVEAEQNRIASYIDVLELMIKEDEIKSNELAHRQLSQMKAEVDYIKTNQDELKSRINSLKSLPLKYKKQADRLKKETKGNLDEELKVHNHMSKKTECYCKNRLAQFKERLDQTKKIFDCYVHKIIDKNAKEIQEQVHAAISKDFYDRTIDVAKSIAEDALQRHVKKSKETMKVAGLFSSMTYKEKSTDLQLPEEDHKTCDGFKGYHQMEEYCDNNNNTNNTIANDDNNEDLNDTSECLTKDQMISMVQQALSRYAADKIAMADFALESMGGSVVPGLSSASYTDNYGFISYFSRSLDSASHSLRMLIQPDVSPGQCWAFAGDKGHATVKLTNQIQVTAVSIDHLPASLSPGGNITSAPKNFNVLIIDENNHNNEINIGSFEYKSGNRSIQTFWIEKPIQASLIKLQVISNHGNKDYTCIYRFRVHGTPILKH